MSTAVAAHIVDPITGRTERHDALLRMLFDLLASERTIKEAITRAHILPETAKELTDLIAKAIQEPHVPGNEQPEVDVAKILFSVFLPTRHMRQVVARHMAATKRCPRTKRARAVYELACLVEDVLGGERSH